MGIFKGWKDGRVPKNVFDEQPSGRRLRGRPRIRWLDKGRDYLRHLGDRRRKQRHREERKAVVAEGLRFCKTYRAME